MDTPQTPIKNNDLDEDLLLLFEKMFDVAYDIRSLYNHDRELVKADYENYHDLVTGSVTKFPMLARTVHKSILNWSLLTLTCEKFCHKWSHRTIKFLIEMNPSALIWRRADIGESPIYAIADHRNHNTLMPWIAQTYPWVLDHARCQADQDGNEIDHPTINLVETYSNGHCSEGTLRNYFEVYPKGLNKKDGIGEVLPLQIILTGHEECSADFFQWMAERDTNTLNYTAERQNWNTLHFACMHLLEYSTENSAKICHYIIDKCPEMMKQTDVEGNIPIHFIARRCNRPAIQGVLVRLLREYPESYDTTVKAWGYPPLDLRSIPFLQHVKPILDEEKIINANIALLQDTSPKLMAATAFSGNCIVTGVSDIFDLWSTSYNLRMKSRCSEFSTAIDVICREFIDEDELSDDENNDNNDGDGAFAIETITNILNNAL